MALHLQRHLTASEFARELGTVHAYRSEYMGDALLERLEEARLVTPRLRMRWPDDVARRFWLEGHDGCVLKHAVEPDGPVLEAARALDKALHRWRNHTVYGLSPHPFDDLDPRFTAFLTRPGAGPFLPWADMRVDVSNNHHAKLYAENAESYYSSWQLMLGAEVADFGLAFQINLAEPATFQSARNALEEGKRPPGHARFHLAPGYVVRDFRKHEHALDAIVWCEEESERALIDIIKDQSGGRFWLNEDQNGPYHDAKTAAAEAACSRYHVGIGELVEVCRFLAGRWANWNREGRPHIADAYKDFLAGAVVMARRIGNLRYTEIRDRVGQQGGWFEPILDVIWPDWTKQEKERVRRTLKGWVVQNQNPRLIEADLDDFVDFLEASHLEAFFWRLRSFENHAFRGNEFALEGMKSDVEGMAVVVEQTMRALGGKSDQLDTLFKELWQDKAVLALLKRNDVAQLMRNQALANDWPNLKAQFRALRDESESGKIAADLAFARRVRGGVHHAMPEGDEFELEQAFIALMRAAALTFAEVKRNRAGPSAGRLQS